MRLATFTTLLIGLGTAWAAPQGAWQTVHDGRGELVQIDTTSVIADGRGYSAWSRIVLERPVRDGAGEYDTIRAQNHYDCAGRRFTTLGRAYFRGETLVREEAVARRRVNPVLAGSLDERMMAIACPGSVATTEQRPDARLNDPGNVPAPMHADLRKSGDGDAVKVFPVADSTTAEKPRLIQLPAIDKAALAQAAAAQETALRAGSDTQKPAAGASAKPVATPSAPVKSAAKSEPREPEALSDRRVRELHYANSGPPRTTRKKAAPAAAEPAHANPAEQLHQHWSYEGETGPAHWARLRPDYSACASGKRQSPIDIRDGIRVNLENIRFDYKPSQFRIVDNGHTVQANIGDSSGLTVMGKRYALQQFHFHRPSEERINGRTYDMSVHLVHRNDEGQLAVVAVMLEKGAEHPLIQTLLNNLPLEQDVEMAPDEGIDPARLLPENRAYWTYMGSLTTPPCTEGVLWMVMKQPLQVSAEQVAIFSRVFRNNARPVQALNGRLIKETR